MKAEAYLNYSRFIAEVKKNLPVAICPVLTKPVKTAYNERQTAFRECLLVCV